MPTGIFIVSLIFYLFFIPNTVYWLDAPEFAAAGFSLGMVHPPGHPLVMLLLRAMDNLPFGSIAFRSNVFSGVFAAMSASILSILTFSVLRCMKTGRTGAEFLAWTAGIGFAFSPALTIQGTGVEVYSLNLFLTLVALCLAFQSGENMKFTVPAAFFLGLGFANHHYLTLLASPAVIWAAYPALKQRPKLLIPSIIAFILPLTAYLYIPIRAPAGPLPSWTDINGASGLFNYISARTFAGSLGGFSMYRVIKNTITAVFMASGQLSPIFLAVSLAGMIITFLKNRRLFAIFCLFIALNLASKVAMSILDPQNPDAYGYFLPSFAILFTFAAVALAPLLKTRLRALAIAGALGLVMSPALFAAGPAMHRRDFHDTQVYTNIALRALPSDSLVMMSFYPSFFLALYDRAITGLRPDCTFIQASLYEKSGGTRAYVQQICQQDESFCPMAKRFVLNHTLDWAGLKGLGKHRPVMFEPAHGMDMLADFDFRGFFFQVPTGNHMILHAQTFRDAINTAFGKSTDVETRRLLLRIQYLDAGLLFLQGRTDDARVLAQSCTRMRPHDPMVIKLNNDLKQTDH